MPCKFSLPVPPSMTFQGQKSSSLRRSHSLSLRTRLGSEKDRREGSLDGEVFRNLNIGEKTTHFYVLQPKPGHAKSCEGKLLQYPRPVLPLRQESVPSISTREESTSLTKHKPQHEKIHLSPKSILKNYSASSYRNPVLTTRTDHDHSIAKQPSCLKSARAHDTNGKQTSSRGHFRYRLSLTAPPAGSDKRVKFDEEVSYINENNLNRRRHSTPSLPLL